MTFGLGETSEGESSRHFRIKCSFSLAYFIALAVTALLMGRETRDLVGLADISSSV